METDQNAVGQLSESKKKAIVLRSRIVFPIAAAVFIAAGIVMILLKCPVTVSVVSLIIGVVCIILFFLPVKDEKKEMLYQSYVSRQKIREAQKNGELQSKDDVDRARFESDPVFHDKVIRSVKSKADGDYRSRVHDAESQVKKLKNKRSSQLAYLEELRWDKGIHKKFAVNMTEGKIKINGWKEALFSQISGFDLNLQTYKKTEGKADIKGKRHLSAGGAVLGGMIGGGTGAVVGALGMGKKSYKGVLTLTTSTVCSHLGVYIGIAGELDEIVLISSDTECGSNTWQKEADTALQILEKLKVLCQTPVPEFIPSLEEDESIRALDVEIASAEEALEREKARLPVYQLPEKYGGGIIEE
ncbi:MAG: SdpI family protein [Clostridia bacterium]|nr:SdpI family protein [Clostridia bacterium]